MLFSEFASLKQKSLFFADFLISVSDEPLFKRGAKVRLGFLSLQNNLKNYFFYFLFDCPCPFDLGVQKYLGKTFIGNTQFILFLASTSF